MIYILHIDTATKVCSVAISKNGKYVCHKESITESFVHGEQLTLYVQDVLRQAQLNITAIAAVSVTSGPGSYTGLRIGVATAKGICYALNIPLISIDSLKNLAYLALKKHPHSILCPMIDARRMEVYNCIYDATLNMLKPISSDIIDQTTYSEFDPFIFFGDGGQKIAPLWESRNVIFDTEILSSANGHIELAFQKYKNKEFEDVAYFEPLYLKDFAGDKTVGK